MLMVNGRRFINPYKAETSLPHGYAPAGTLTAEQAYNTGLEGAPFFTHPDEPDDLYTYQLCGTPTGLEESDAENRNWMYLRWIRADRDALKERRLTLDDVRFLAQKGEALSWDDFAAYPGTDIGSGLFIMQYGIDDMFEVLVGGTSREEEPWYIHLRNREFDEWIDIRTGEVDAFIETYAGTDNNAGSDTPAEPEALLTVRSAGKTVQPYLHFAYHSEWTENGFLVADGRSIEGELTEWAEADHLPELVYAEDLAVAYAEKVSFGYSIPFDASMQQMDTMFDVKELANLKPGRYYIGICIQQEGNYIEQVERSEYTGWVGVVRLIVE